MINEVPFLTTNWSVVSLFVLQFNEKLSWKQEHSPWPMIDSVSRLLSCFLEQRSRNDASKPIGFFKEIMSMFNDIGLVAFRNRKERNGRWRDDAYVISRSRWNERERKRIRILFFVSLSLSLVLSFANNWYQQNS